jgi:glucokinase
MGMARSTVLQRLELLAEQELIINEMANSRSRGRPATLAVFNPAAAYVLAAHVGLTGCRLAATDLNGSVLSQHFLDVDLTIGPNGLLEGLESGFEQLTAEANLDPGRLAGIGVGFPRGTELLSYLHSLRLNATDWGREHFHQALQTRYRVPVYIDTDVNLLALAERSRSWPDSEVFICVKLGTIIDAAVIVNGEPIRGASRMAGELAHIKVGDHPEPCTCGGVGCLDAIASGAALVRQLQASGLNVQHVSQVIKMANEGVPIAVHAVRDAGRYIGEALSAVVNLLNPEAIAVWGYLADAEALLFSGIREGIYRGALPQSSEPLTLVPATLGELAGALGASRMVISEVLKPDSVDQILAAGWANSPA